VRPMFGDQLERIARQTLYVVNLVQLRTYVARDSAQIESQYFLSDRAVTYGANAYFPFLLEVGELSHAIEHIQALSGRTGMRRSWGFSARNGEIIGGTTLWGDLRRRKFLTLEVAWAQLFLDRPGTAADWAAQVAAMSGDEATVLFRGELDEAPGLSEYRLSFSFRSLDLSSVRYDYAAVTDYAAPDDRGKAFPLPIFGFTGRQIRATNIDARDSAAAHEYVTTGIAGTSSPPFQLWVRGRQGKTIEISPSTSGFSYSAFTTQLGRTAQKLSIAKATVDAYAILLDGELLTFGDALEVFTQIRGTSGLGGALTSVTDALIRVICGYQRVSTDVYETQDGVPSFMDPLVNVMGDGYSVESILAHMAFDGGANVVMVERASGTKIIHRKLRNRASEWPTPIVEIPYKLWQALEEEVKPFAAMATEFTFLSHWSALRGTPGDPSAYAGATVLDEAHPSIPDSFGPALIGNDEYQLAVDSIGRIPHEPFMYRSLFVDNQRRAVSVVHARAIFDRGSLFRLVGVPHVYAWRLEPGDIIGFTPPWTRTAELASGIPIRARVLETTYRPHDGFVDLVAVEVFGLSDQLVALWSAKATLALTLSIPTNAVATWTATATKSFTLTAYGYLAASWTATATMDAELPHISAEWLAFATLSGSLTVDAALAATWAATATLVIVPSNEEFIGGFQRVIVGQPQADFAHMACLEFNGTTDRLDYVLEEPAGITTDWSILVWAKIGGPGVVRTILRIKRAASPHSNIQIDVTAADELRVQLWNTTGTVFKDYETTDSALAYDRGWQRWVLICVSWNGTTLKLYRNGTELTALSKPTDAAGSQAYTDRSIHVGSNDGATFFSGRLHSLAFFDPSLTENDIRSAFAHGFGSHLNILAFVDEFAGFPARWWRFGRAGQLADAEVGTRDLT